MFERWFGVLRNWGTLPLRIATGLIFLAHGSQKLFGAFGGHGLKGTAGFLSQLGLEPAIFWAVVVAATEFFGGLFVLLGLLTRWASSSLSVVMVVALITVHAKNGFFLANHGYEYNLAILGMTLSLLFTGAGRASLDDALKIKI